jgi:DNA-binding transcriptional regulator YhcF (GntR family)
MQTVALSLAERKRIHVKAKRLLGLLKEETKNDDVEQCIIDLTDAGVDEDEAQSICEDIYGDE